MPINGTRGRSYTNFPRNTKQAYIKACADAEREARIKAEQVERAYQEHNPAQIEHELEMQWAHFDKFERDVIAARKAA